MQIPTESVATVLKQELTPTIERWMQRVDQIPELTVVTLNYQDRTGHLPQLLADLIARLETEGNRKNPETTFARNHGKVRHGQGYTALMLVEESRLLQISIFDTLRLNQGRLNAGEVLTDVMTIADECDAQLKDTMEIFMALEQNKRAVA